MSYYKKNTVETLLAWYLWVLWYMQAHVILTLLCVRLITSLCSFKNSAIPAQEAQTATADSNKYPVIVFSEVGSRERQRIRPSIGSGDVIFRDQTGVVP